MHLVENNHQNHIRDWTKEPVNIFKQCYKSLRRENLAIGWLRISNPESLIVNRVHGMDISLGNTMDCVHSFLGIMLAKHPIYLLETGHSPTNDFKSKASKL